MDHFELVSEYAPTGDQPEAIEGLVKGFQEGKKCQTLLGVTGSGKTFTMANVIAQLNKPTIIISHNKTLAAQLYSEFKAFFPHNAVEYFVSYYDYYQPEAYIPSVDKYIEKDLMINDEIERLRLEVEKLIGKPVALSIVEVRTPDTNAQLVAESIAQQLEKRIGFRRAMKNAMGRAMRAGAKGIKCCCSGRLGGREIAGVEHYHEGTIPLQTIRADIEYGFAEAATTYGRIGVKVWIYKGEVLSQTLRTTPRTMDTSKPYQERRERRPRRDGDRRGGFGGDRRNGGFNRDRQGGFNRQGGAERRPQGGFRPNTNRPAAPAAPAKEGGAN